MSNDFEWKEYLLNDLCEDVRYGFTASASEENVGPKFLRITDIVPDQIQWNEVPYCEIPDKELGKYKLSEGDIVVARTGATTGYAKRIKNPPKSVFASYLVRIKIKENFDDKFVGHVVQSDLFKEFIKKNWGGSAQPNANAKIITSFPIKVPDLDTQQKIASILSAFDDLIENNTRRIAILEEMALLIYREWFVHYKYPGHENDRLVDSGTELGDVPEGWEVKTFGDLVNYLRDSVKNEDVDVEVPVLGLGDMPKESICLSDWETTSDIGSTKLKFKRDDILFGKIRPYFHKVGFAQIDGFSSSDIFIWRVKDQKDFVLALLTASSDKFVETATNSSSGTKMPRAKWDVLANYRVTYPTADVLEKLNSLIGSSLNQIRTLSIQNKRLRETRDLLLPRLISGKLVV